MSQRESDLLGHFDSLNKVKVILNSDIIKKIIASGQTNVVSITAKDIAYKLEGLLQKNTSITEEFLVEFFMCYYSTLPINNCCYFSELELVLLVNFKMMATIGNRCVLHDKENYLHNKVLRSAIVLYEVNVLNSAIFSNNSVASTLQLDLLTVASFLKHSVAQSVQKLNNDEKAALLEWIIQHFDHACFNYCSKLFTFPIFNVYKRKA
jgi:hypothetical protein